MVIGVYGIIGSGKSTVARIFKENFNFNVIDVDKIGHEVLGFPEVKEKLLKEFGDMILKDDGVDIDNKILGDIAFSNKVKKKLLENIMWPFMTEIIESKIKENNRVLIDAAVLYSAGWDKFCDYTIYVYSFVPIIILRLLKKNKYSFIKIYHIIRAQKNIIRDSFRADFKINNSFKLDYIYKKVDCIWKKISA
jgi:dephospho-CoA kinase